MLWIGGVALLLSAFQLVPLWIDRAIINRTPQDQVWKSDSFGAAKVMEWLVTGQLMDNGRFPILSLLVLAGLIVLWLRFFSPRGMELAGKFAVAGAALWLLLFFGRPFWGPALWLFGITPDLPSTVCWAARRSFSWCSPLSDWPRSGASCRAACIWPPPLW